MPILIKRKIGTNLTWEANALFKASFPKGEDVFEIPNINYMTYLHKSFDLIEATDEEGNEIDLTKIQNCCGQSIKLEIVQQVITSTLHESLNNINITDNIIKEDENIIDPHEER